MNYYQNRKIKADRVYKTLGRMSWQRVVLGVILLLYVLMLAGTVSEFLLMKGRYNAAETFMVDRWMENYKPEEKALIDAWAAYDNGDCDTAFEQIEDIDYNVLPSRLINKYTELCTNLADHYTALSDSESLRRVEVLTETVKEIETASVSKPA